MLIKILILTQIYLFLNLVYSLHLKSTSFTSNIRVALPGITPGIPRGPYAAPGGQVSEAL